MAQSVKCLSHEHENLSLDTQDPHKNSGMVAYTCNTIAGEAETRGLANQPS